MSGIEVTVAEGRLRGRRDGDIAAFLGVPYAAPPFGEGRLRPPRPAVPWAGVREAAEFGPTVPKTDYWPTLVPFFPEVSIPGEECLNVNIWAPAGGKDLPVLVWIHGGAFTNGSNSLAEYDGAAWARDGVVFVSVNYRLGAEGFLYTGDSPDDIRGNLGLLDQIAALEWVRDNIAAFGGDPERVTVAGESAGAWAVCTLLGAPRAAGLFHQAIAQSGGAQHHLRSDQALLVARELAAALGIEPTAQAFAQVPPERLAEATLDLITELQTAPDPAKWGGDLALTGVPFAPVTDGDVLPGPPLDTLAAGLGTQVPTLISTTAEEGLLFLVANGWRDLIDDDTLAAVAAGYGLAPKDVAVYRANRPQASPAELLAAIVTDWFFRIPSIRVAEALSAAPVWVYRFDWASPVMGAAHAVDIPFAFDTLAARHVGLRIGEHPPQAVADVSHALWVGFVAKGDPGWDRYDLARATALVSDTVQVVSDPAGDERVLWAGRR